MLPTGIVTYWRPSSMANRQPEYAGGAPKTEPLRDSPLNAHEVGKGPGDAVVAPVAVFGGEPDD